MSVISPVTVGNVFALFSRHDPVVNAGEQLSAPTFKLKIGYIPIAECAHLYVGIAKKFYAQEGLEIELLPMKGGAAILPAIQTGDLDIGFTNVPSVGCISWHKCSVCGSSLKYIYIAFRPSIV